MLRRLGVCVLIATLPLTAAAQEISLVKHASRVTSPAASKKKAVAVKPKARQDYQVRPGDSLSKILVDKLNPRHEDMAALMAEVRRLNPHIADINNIPAGRSIVLPGYGAGGVKSAPLKAAASRAPKPAVVTTQPVKASAPSTKDVQEVIVVQRGQSIGLILHERYGLPDTAIFGEFMESIKVANPGIRNLDHVSPGQQIVIPKIPDKFFKASQPVAPTAASATAPRVTPAAQPAKPSASAKPVADVHFVDVPKGAVVVKRQEGDPLPAKAAPAATVSSVGAPAKAEPSAASRTLVRTLGRMGLDLRTHGSLYVPAPSGESLNVDLSKVPVLELPGGRRVFLDVDGRLNPALRRCIQAVLPASAFVDAQSDMDSTVGAALRQAGFYSVNHNTPIFVGAEEKLRFSGNYVVYKDSSRRSVCVVNLLPDDAERTPAAIIAYAKRYGVEIVEMGGRAVDDSRSSQAAPIVQLNHSYPQLLQTIGCHFEQGVRLQLVNEDPVRLSYVAPLKLGQVILADRLPDETTQNLLRMRGFNLIKTSESNPAELLATIGHGLKDSPFRYTLPNGRTVIELDAYSSGSTLLLARPIDSEIARYLAARGFRLLIW